MLALVTALLLTAQSPAVDVLHRPVARPPTTAPVGEAASHPLETRNAVSDAIRAGDFTTAARLAADYAQAWQDSFLVRQVTVLSQWPLSRLRARLLVDSLRREGVTAYGRDGATAAIVMWRSAIVRGRGLGDSAMTASLLGNLGAGFYRQGTLDSAERYLTAAAALAHAVGDRRVEGNAVTLLAAVSEDLGDLEAARVRARQAHALHQQIGDSRGVAADLNNLGNLAWRVGDVTEATRQFEAALALNQREGRDEIAATNLVNLAGLATSQGRFASAQRQYRDAIATWRARGQWAELADALNGLGQLEMRRGDFSAAQRVLAEASTILTRTGPLSTELQVRRTLAGALAAQGQLQSAIDLLRVTDDLARRRAAAVTDQAALAMSRADLALRLNRLTEADGLYQRAERQYRESTRRDGEAAARYGRGLVKLATEDYTGAQALLTSALRAQQGGTDPRAAELTRLALGQLARAEGDSARARRHLTQADLTLRRLGDSISAAIAHGELAGLAADAALPAAAEVGYREALRLLEGRVAPDAAWPLLAGLAQARQARGATDDAAGLLRQAIAQVERAGRSLALPEQRSAFWADKWDVYAQLALLEERRGNAGAAFDMSERMRAREMLELLGRGRIEGGTDSIATTLVTREQDLRRYITDATNRLEGVAAGPLRGPPLVEEGGAIREAMLRAQGAYADLLLEMRERAPRHDELVGRPTASWRDVSRRLPRDEAMIEYLVSDSGTVAFVITSDTVLAIPIDLGHRELARRVEFARGIIESSRSHLDSTWRTPYRQLHRQLIAPIEESGALRGVTKLILVPHAELHYLPFAALLGDTGPLIDRYELVAVPSASVWLSLGERTTRPQVNGVLAMAPRAAVLPGSVREVRTLAQLVGQPSQLVIGTAATESAFRRDAAGKRILHLATYGVLNKHNPLFSFVEFAPDSANDGRLEVHEVFGLRIDADLVVLSACQTALGSGRLSDVPAGDDWVGLTRAFLHAGARRVVATLWAVDDQATARLMEGFYRQGGAGPDPAQALARAQRAMLRARDTSHPFYWAGIVLVEGSSGPGS
ncbi:MAG: CHAT domain-containing protein [Gemmatimonadota bacterium]